MDADESGQSVIELLLMFPVMVLLILMLVNVATVIQVGHVNQQYARAQALFLTYNSSIYPRLKNYRAEGAAPMIDSGVDQMTIGVSDKVMKDDGSANRPQPTIVRITRPGAPVGNEQEIEPTARGRIRVRTTVALCTQLNSVQGPGGNVALTSSTFPEEPKFRFCRGSFQ